MRILFTEFRQESNSLSPFISDLRFWEDNGWVLEPAQVRAAHEGTGSALSGMLETIEGAEPGTETIFGPAFYAQSGGTAAQEVMDLYTARLIEVLRAEHRLDAILFSFHGALQTTGFDDAEAEVLRRVREVVGEDVVIGASTDLHGYVSRGFAQHADIICGYQTYPHVDFHETGARAARLVLRLLDPNVVDPLLAWVPVPMMVSASAYNSLEGPFAEIIRRGRELVDRGSIRDFSVYQMQPWLDVPTPHSSVLVVADDETVARRHAEELAQELYAVRHAFTSELASIDDVIDLALDPAVPKPVILVDSADSTNAGASGDSMAVAARLFERTVVPSSATVVSDPAAAAKAHEVGVGASAGFRIGGSVDPNVPQVSATGYVRSLHDGSFRPQLVGHTGDLVRVGRAAVLRFGNVDVLVCEHIAGNGDPQLYRAFGIEPTMYALVVVKANTSFRAGYAGIAGTIVPTDTPGAASANVESLPFKRLSRTVYPWLDGPFKAVSEIPRRR